MENNDGFFYSSYDNLSDISKSELSAKTQFHKLNTPQSTDELIYGGKKQPNNSGSVTEDQRYLEMQNTSPTLHSRLDNPSSKPIKIQSDYLLEQALFIIKEKLFICILILMLLMVDWFP